MAWKYFALQLAIAYGLAALAWATRRFPNPSRRWAGAIVYAGILLSPFIIPGRAKPLRLAAMMNVAMLAAKVYDLRSRSAGESSSFQRSYLANLWNPFALTISRVRNEPSKPFKVELHQMSVNLVCGLTAFALTIAAFLVDWSRHSFITEHATKAVCLFLFIQFLPNAIAGFARLLGFPATQFAGPYFLAPTPAVFWQRYNRPAGQFLYEHVFKPANGRRHPVRATLVTFFVSGIIHEYVFDLPTARILGTQMAFFMIQGIAVAATMHLRPRGWSAALGILLTLAFNIACVYLFLHGLNAVLPFYTAR